MSNETRAASDSLLRALRALGDRHRATTDAAERAEIEKAMDVVELAFRRLLTADLLNAAEQVSQAASALEKAIAAARQGPFDRYLVEIGEVLAGLEAARGTFHSIDRLETAPARAFAASGSAAALAPAASPPGGLGAPSTKTDFESLKNEYAAWFKACKTRPERADNIAYYLKRLAQYKERYVQVSQPLGVPWLFTGILHAMEAGFNFGGHLHNGDPLTARTVCVPKGRPATGQPPFTWNESAADALRLKGLHEITDWSVPRQLYLFEKFNGFGYRRMGRPTPYLWSFSQLYEKGKYVADGKFDPEAVSKQSGAAVILKEAVAKKL